MQFDAVVVANGQFPIHQVPLSILSRAPHIVACDGAVIHVPHAEAKICYGSGEISIYKDK